MANSFRDCSSYALYVTNSLYKGILHRISLTIASIEINNDINGRKDLLFLIINTYAGYIAKKYCYMIHCFVVYFFNWYQRTPGPCRTPMNISSFTLPEWSTIENNFHGIVCVLRMRINTLYSKILSYGKYRKKWTLSSIGKKNLLNFCSICVDGITHASCRMGRCYGRRWSWESAHMSQ